MKSKRNTDAVTHSGQVITISEKSGLHLSLIPESGSQTLVMKQMVSNIPKDTFEIGERLGTKLRSGDVVLLYGGLGAGKTLLTKGILNALNFDIDEVTSPSFTLVNLYKTVKFDVYHIDLWRLDGNIDAAEAVGLAELLENDNVLVIIEWADRLRNYIFPTDTVEVHLKGDGDEPRKIEIKYPKEAAAI